MDSYDLVLDLTAEPVTSRSEVRFRCRVPGAETFADLQLATEPATIEAAETAAAQLAAPYAVILAEQAAILREVEVSCRLH